MENQVFSRLERVSESITKKNYQLQGLRQTVAENDKRIKSLKEKQQSFGSFGAIDFAIAAETAKAEEYQAVSRPFLIILYT